MLEDKRFEPIVMITLTGVLAKGDEWLKTFLKLSKAYDIYGAGEAPEESDLRGGGAFEETFREELRRMFEEGQAPATTAQRIQESSGPWILPFSE